MPRKFKPPAGEAYSRIESARGDMGWYYVIAGAGENAYRCKIRTGSFTAMGIIDPLSAAA